MKKENEERNNRKTKKICEACFFLLTIRLEMSLI